MPPDHPTRTNRGGSATADRLASRLGGVGSLQRKHVPGGEVYSGDLGTRALSALGARAMTVDRSIIVSENFDPSNPHDQALLAHERHHLEHSGGQGENTGRDAEEIAARAIERMVMHTMAGGMESHDAGHAGAAAAGGDSRGPMSAGGQNLDKEHDAAARGYEALRARGLSHQEVLTFLAREVITSVAAQREQGQVRMSDKKGFQ